MTLPPDRPRLAHGLRRALAPIFAALLLVGFPAIAAESELSSSGVLHSVKVESRQIAAGNGGGTRLVHTVQFNGQTIDSKTVAGTDDAPLDVEPAIFLSPLSGLPVIVWSRQEGSDYEIAFSIYDGEFWSPPQVVTANAWEDRKPQLTGGASGYVHVVWTGPNRPDGTPRIFESVIDAKGAIVKTASEVSVSPAASVTPTVAAPPMFDPTQLLFAVDMSSKTQPRIVCYGGGIDEPIPIQLRLDFLLPSGSGTIVWAKLEVIERRVVMIARYGTKVWYAVQETTGWTPLKSISLDGFSDDQAQLLIRRMVGRNETP